jgi:hypothetical protein
MLKSQHRNIESKAKNGHQFILTDRDTPYTLPPCVQDYLPEDHLARFVAEIVDQLDLCGLGCLCGQRQAPLPSGDVVGVVVLRLCHRRLFQP